VYFTLRGAGQRLSDGRIEYIEMGPGPLYAFCCRDCGELIFTIPGRQKEFVSELTAFVSFVSWSSSANTLDGSRRVQVSGVT
jgi:hypothetical protein